MNGTFGGGSGTISDPYLVEDVYDFCEMGKFDSKYFKLVNNLDFNDHETYKNGIKSSLMGNTVRLDGDGKTVKNLFMLDVSIDILKLQAHDVNFENVYLMDCRSWNSSGAFRGNYTNCRFYITLLNSNASYALCSGSATYTNCAITLTGTVSNYIVIPYLFETHLHFKDLKFAPNNAPSSILSLSKDIKRSYVTGQISLLSGTGTGVSYTSYLFTYTSGVTVDLSYFAFKFIENGGKFNPSYVCSGDIVAKNGSFFDYELMGYSTKPNGMGLQALTTAEAKDVDKLNSVGFICVKVD